MGPSHDSRGRRNVASQESSQAEYQIEDDEHDHDEDEDQPEEDEIGEELEGNPQDPGEKKSALSNVVRWLSDSIGVTDAKYQKKLRVNLKKATMFRKVSDPYIERIAQRMDRILFKKGDVLMIQGEPQYRAWIIVQGNVLRKRLIDDQLHQMGSLGHPASKDTIGMFHLLYEEPCYTTVIAQTDGVAYVLNSVEFRDMLDSDPDFSQEVIQSLVHQIRDSTVVARTPLFLQTGKVLPTEPLPWFAISCAAAIESFYRSGLNALLIAQLSSGQRGKLFPNMHIQIPSRIMYINGFKGARHLIDNNIDLDEYQGNSQLAGMGLACIPGLIMTPLSSLLEACNVGHMNKEPLALRWTRGLVPRCAREIIFGVGINQLSDFCEERLDNIFINTTMRNLAGSLVAGCLAGYLSHIPHNLSTLKLLDPKTNYTAHFRGLRKPYEEALKVAMPKMRSPRLRTGMASLLTVVLPKGSLIRTTQIAGSFIIINASINALSKIKVDVSLKH